MSTRAVFLAQAKTCEATGSSFTARLCRLFARRLTKADRVSATVLDWPNDAGGQRETVPLRLTTALHALVLSGADMGLATVYPPHDTRASDGELWMAIEAAFNQHEEALLERLKSPPQANEANWCAALCPGFLAIARLTRLPLRLSELGAGAGLNLHWDQFGYRFGSIPWGPIDPALELRIGWAGPPPPLSPVRVTERAGCDGAPMDPGSEQTRTDLLAHVWPDQTARIARVQAALNIIQKQPERVTAASAPNWLKKRLSQTPADQTHVVYHSALGQSLPQADRAACTELILEAGKRAASDQPLAWLRLEEDSNGPGAALMLTLWPGGETRQLGRADPHGTWMNWTGWT